jgi:dihydrodipicolinate synthase/N-acetylneuraminate lyase
MVDTDIRRHLLDGQAIPAHPLALDASRRLDERHQRALTRYYVAAGAGGIAVGVHTTQFAIRQHGLYRPLLELAAETSAASLARTPRPFIRIAGLIGDTRSAVAEAETAVAVGYDAGLLSLGAWRGAGDAAILDHCRAVAGVIPLFGFYLQPAVGGRVLDYAFWRELAEIRNVVAIKIAPFNRYRTLDVVRAVVDAKREDIALYTGNDDSIIPDLLAPVSCTVDGRPVERRIVGGLLGQWAVWTRTAVQMLAKIKRVRDRETIDVEWLRLGTMLTDANGALFDVRHEFAGSIAGIHEVLRRQGLMRGIWCLDSREGLSEGQLQEIDRVLRVHPILTDDAFVAEHLDEWLRG